LIVTNAILLIESHFSIVLEPTSTKQ